MYFDFKIKSAKDILLEVSDEEIMSFYFGEFEYNHWYLSPFRKESTPSFTIDRYKDKLAWRDFGRSKKPQNVWEFIKLKFNISFEEALQKVYKDIVLNKENLSLKTPNKYISKKKSAGVKIRHLNKKELEFWEQGKVSQNELKFYNIFSGELWNNSRVLAVSQKDSPLFIYVFDRAKKVWQAYKPYATDKEIKFFTNNSSGEIQNWANLGLYQSDVLFITKSYKDCIVLNKLGYDAISPFSEHSFLDVWDIDYLKTIYPNIYVFFDNDETGVRNCTRFTEQFNLNYVNIPTSLKEGVKDPWDVVVNFDYNILKDIIYDKFIRDGI